MLATTVVFLEVSYAIKVNFFGLSAHVVFMTTESATHYKEP